MARPYAFLLTLLLSALVLRFAACANGSANTLCDGQDCVENSLGLETETAPVPALPFEDEGCGGICTAPAPLCNEAQARCVSCLETAHCTEPSAAACDFVTGDCGGCTEDAHCERFTDTPVCDAERGQCVACKRGREQACGEFVCDTAAQRCTDLRVNSAGACQPCIANAQCLEGQACIAMQFGPDDTTIGNFCLWMKASTVSTAHPEGDCGSRLPYIDDASPNLTPYVNVTDVVSLDGNAVQVCAPRETTCVGLLQGLDEVDCAPNGVPDHSLCGAAGVNDAYCVQLTASVFTCSTPCRGSRDCRNGVACKHYPELNLDLCAP